MARSANVVVLMPTIRAFRPAVEAQPISTQAQAVGVGRFKGGRAVAGPRHQPQFRHHSPAKVGCRPARRRIDALALVAGLVNSEVCGGTSMSEIG
jgi:hypothetical protein